MTEDVNDRTLELEEELEVRSSQSIPPMAHEAARAMTIEAFRRLLNREPEDSALNAYCGALLSNALTPFEMVLELIESQEFKNQAQQAIAPITREAARATAVEAFALILRREPEESALEAYSEELMANGASPLDIVRKLIGSEEFGSRAQCHPTVARHLARTMITTLMERDPGSHVVAAYAGSIENGYSLKSFIRELVDSDEFLKLSSAFRSSSMTSPLIAHELSQLAEQLIVAKLVNEGFQIAIPPRQLGERTAISENGMRTMLHTLAMLADSDGDQVETVARPLRGGDDLDGLTQV